MPVKWQNSKVFKVSTVYVRSFSLCSAAQYITNSKMQTVMKIEGLSLCCIMYLGKLVMFKYNDRHRLLNMHEYYVDAIAYA